MGARGRLVALGRVRGHRGGSGEITVRVPFGDAEFWIGLSRVVVEVASRPEAFYAVDRARAYRDRLVLKLAGVDNPGTAARLRGAEVRVDAEHARELAAGRFQPALFVGLVACDPEGREVGRIVGLERTPGSPLLVIEGRPSAPGRRREILLPAVPALVGPIDEPAGIVTVRPPEGLLELGAEEDARR